MPGAVVTFRTATRNDVPVIVALLEDDEVTRSRVRSSLLPEADDARQWAAFEAIDADPRNELIVAERDGEIVGTCQLTFTPSLSRRGAERMTVEGVRVRSDIRGGGIGRAMMRWVVDRARERGCGLVQLTTDKRRTDAHRFYALLGFEATHLGFKLNL